MREPDKYDKLLTKERRVMFNTILQVKYLSMREAKCGTKEQKEGPRLCVAQIWWLVKLDK
jgi:hypothetical protein